jgi:hypothetical protein
VAAAAHHYPFEDRLAAVVLDLPAGLAGPPIAVDGWGFVHKEEGQGNPRPYRYT